jgi:hypothetical protein
MIAHFTARITNACELCQLDSSGEILKRDQQTKFIAGIPITCTSDDKTIDVGISLIVEADNGRVEDLDREQRLAAVAYVGSNEVIPRLARHAAWKLYEAERIDLSGTGRISPAQETYELKRDETLAEAVAQQLSQATAFHGEIAVAFEKAKEFLLSNVGSLRYDPGRARGAAHFLADCMRSDAAPFMSSWNREKAARLISEVDDLIRRKNPNHQGYRAAGDWIQSILYQIRPPAAWARYPPSPRQLNT